MPDEPQGSAQSRVNETPNKKTYHHNTQVTFEQIRRGKSLTFEEVFVQETRLGTRMVVRVFCLVSRGFSCRNQSPQTQHGDFAEGVHKILVAKKEPVWNPATLDQVSNDKVEWFFEPVRPLFEEGVAR